MDEQVERAKAVLEEALKKHPKFTGKVSLNFFEGKVANANVGYTVLVEGKKKVKS